MNKFRFSITKEDFSKYILPILEEKSLEFTVFQATNNTWFVSGILGFAVPIVQFEELCYDTGSESIVFSK